MITFNRLWAQECIKGENDRRVTVSGQSVKALRIQILTVSGSQLVSLCEDNGHLWGPRVTLLQGETNWASWKVQMRHQLRSRKLWNLVKGEEQMAAGAERPAVEAFEERCVEATVRLTHAMSPTVVLLVQALDCPVEIWKKLERQYEKGTAASKLSLVQRYFGAKMAEGHLLNMSELCDRLAAMELPVPEEFQPLMILASLPSSHTAIVQTLGSQEGKLDLSHVTSTIMDEEARRRNNGGHATDPQALISHGGQPNRNPARRVQCYNCEKLGHFSRDCTEPPREHSQQTAPAQRGGGSRPKNRKPQHKARVAVVEDEEENPEPFCFCTGIERGVKAEEWVVDRGATTHMTWDKGVFVTFAALQDMPSVRLGDGRTVKAEGKGSVRLRVSNNNDAECVIRLSSVLLVPDLSCNLFSVRGITNKGNKMLLDDVTCIIITKDNSVIASGHKRGILYVLDRSCRMKA